jgi:mannan endo-1,4-beta-mannosidase
MRPMDQSTARHRRRAPRQPVPRRYGVRPRLHYLVAVALVSASVAFAIHRTATSSPIVQRPVVHAQLPPSPASYLGVFAAWMPLNYQPIQSFAKAVGERPNLAGYYSRWGQPFASSFARVALAHGAWPLVQIEPTYASVSEIAKGRYDGYLRSYADSVRNLGKAVVIGFGREMNALTFPWGYRRVPASTFVAAWRHIVRLFAGQRADNVTWLWTIAAGSSRTGPIASWWPGAGYVTWVGVDGYYYRRSDTFARVFGTTIEQVRAFSRKPLLLSETGVWPRAGQPAKIGDLFAGMRQYQTLGLVWSDVAERRRVHHQNWRIDNSPVAKAAFRLHVSALALARP